MLRYEKYWFYLLVILALSIILLPKYYITGDGGSHTYNARVLFDMVFGNGRGFYSEFYSVNRNIDPNWMSHLLIGSFLQIFPPWLADKLFQLIYVLTFAFGFRYLIRSLEASNTFLSFLFFPFMFTLAFQQGFYNYCISLALLFWTLGFYIRIRRHLQNPLAQLILSLLLLATAFSHGMPAIYVMILITLIWLTDNHFLLLPFNPGKFMTAFSQLILIFLPSMFMILLFILKRGTGTEPHAWGVGKKLLAFFSFWGSQSTRHMEVYPAVATGLLLLLYLGILSFTRMRVNIPKRSAIGFVFLFMALFSFISYLSCPHSVGGAGSLDLRLVFLPPLFLLLFYATKNWNPVHKSIFISCSFLVSIAFLVIRFPYVVKASAIGKEIMTVAPYIPPQSVVLNLHADDWQRLGSHDSLFHKDGSFIHFSDFLGAERNARLIMVMNYEAEINYFPVNWKPGRNPAQSIAGMIPGHYPPCGNIAEYEKQIGRKIDFVLVQNWRKDAEDSQCIRDLVAQFNAGFSLVYESRNNYVMLLKRL